MAEALAFVSLAGNVLQFLQFAGSIVSHARQAYRSVDGSPKSYQEMVLVAKDLEKCTTSFDDTTDPDTKSLIDECKSISLELRTVLDKIPKPKGPGHKMASVKSAFASKWYEPDIDQAEKRLENLRNELILCIQTFLKRDMLRLLESSDSNGKKIDLVIQTQDESLSQIVGSLDAARVAILDRCNGINMVLGELVTEFRDVRKLLEDLINCQTRPHTGVSPGTLIEAPPVEDFLDTLKFRFQDDREESIAESSLHTFEWMLMDPDEIVLDEDDYDIVPAADGQTYAQQRRALMDSVSKDFEDYGREEYMPELDIGRSNTDLLEKFKLWLRGGKGIFWIFGKPGSGKSTFMKAMVQNPVMRARLDEMLTSASPDGDFTLASFYFFRAGSVSLQKSKEGMLRSLLHQILRQRPQQINGLFSINEQLRAIRRVAAANEDEIAWSINELRRAFKKSRHLDDSLLYLHIDGIDEIEGQPREIANLLNELAACPHVKILTAGRHCAAFNHGLPRDQRMNLSDYTTLDIASLVLQKLHDPRLQDVNLDPNQFARLTRAMISTAQGIFLWVAIVSESILDGASQFESFEQLWERIQEYPADLDQLYDSILWSIDPRYLADASFWILFVHTGLMWKNVKELCYYSLNRIFTEDILRVQEMDFEDSSTIIRAKRRQITADELDTAEKRIQAQCPHIFDIRKDTYGDRIITYSHRTFLDFLSQHDDDKIKKLGSNISPSKSVDLCFIASRLFTSTKPFALWGTLEMLGGMIWELLEVNQYASGRKIWACAVPFLREEEDPGFPHVRPTLSGWGFSSARDLVRPGDLAMALIATLGHYRDHGKATERDIIVLSEFLANAQFETAELELILLTAFASALPSKLGFLLRTLGVLSAVAPIPRFALRLGQIIPEGLPRNSLCASRILEAARVVSEEYFSFDDGIIRYRSSTLNEDNENMSHSAGPLNHLLLWSTDLMECFCDFVEAGADPNILAVHAYDDDKADQISVLTLIRAVDVRFKESRERMRQPWTKETCSTDERLSGLAKSIRSLGGLELRVECSVSSFEPGFREYSQMVRKRLV